MSRSSILANLENKRSDAGDVAERACKDPDLLSDLLVGIASAKPEVKYGAIKALAIVSKKYPQMLYPQMDFFEALLNGENQILKWNAIDIIANLTVVDIEGRFDRVFEEFYSHLGEGNLITAGHVVDSSGTIVKSKPELAAKIERKLLEVYGVPLPTEECRNILIGKAINAFDSFYEEAEDKEGIIAFVKRETGNSRNATRKKAERFLKKWVRARRSTLL